MPKTREETQLTREKIIHASYEVIRSKGYEKMTRDDIARQVGMTRGAVNWHFASKEEIYLAVLNQILDDFQRERAEYYEDRKASPREKIDNLISMPLRMRDQYRFLNDIPRYMLSDERFAGIIGRMAENRKYFIQYVTRCLTEIEEASGKTYQNKTEIAHLIYFLHEGLHSNYADTAFGSPDVIQENYRTYVALLLEIP